MSYLVSNSNKQDNISLMMELNKHETSTSGVTLCGWSSGSAIE